jgi:hypothetical protein
MENQAFTELNDDLLGAATGAPELPREPKRNTKDELIHKIMLLSRERNLAVPHSNTKLRRMTKRQLADLLAELIEQTVHDEVCDKAGVSRGAPPDLIALGALRMVHDLAAGAGEQLGNVFLPKYGFEICGFKDALSQPHVREATDQCLLEISRETDILQHIQSPYTRLALAWGGALMASVRRVGPKQQHRRRARFARNYRAPMSKRNDDLSVEELYDDAPDLEPGPPLGQDPPELGVRRGPPLREVGGDRLSPPSDAPPL